MQRDGRSNFTKKIRLKSLQVPSDKSVPNQQMKKDKTFLKILYFFSDINTDINAF